MMQQTHRRGRRGRPRRRRRISDLLDQAGFDVTVARTGRRGARRDPRAAPDLVTLDLTLPDIDGVEVCRQIRRSATATSSWSAPAPREVDRLIGLEVGADDYLVKPFSMRELQARVAALFRRPRSPTSVAVDGGDPRLGVRSPPSTSRPVRPTRTPLGCNDLTLNHGVPRGPGRRRGDRPDPHRVRPARPPGAATPAWSCPARTCCARCGRTDFVPDSTHVVDVHLANLRRKLRGAAAGQPVDPHHPRRRLPLRSLLPLTAGPRVSAPTRAASRRARRARSSTH